MSEYYHDLLWHSVGSKVEKTILWGGSCGDSSMVFIPYSLQHPKMCLGLANVLSDLLYAKFGGEPTTIAFTECQTMNVG